MPEDIPRLGLGTYSESNREQWAENIRRGLETGYRHVDTAQAYGNERYVGEGLARWGRPTQHRLYLSVARGAFTVDDLGITALSNPRG